jgi:hypothetical protein
MANEVLAVLEADTLNGRIHMPSERTGGLAIYSGDDYIPVRSTYFPFLGVTIGAVV